MKVLKTSGECHHDCFRRSEADRFFMSGGGVGLGVELPADGPVEVDGVVESIESSRDMWKESRVGAEAQGSPGGTTW